MSLAALLLVAQLAPFETVAVIDFAGMTGIGAPALIIPIEANGTPEKELLVYDSVVQKWALVVPNAKRSGPLGSIRAPGVCIEAFFTTQTRPTFGATIAIGDYNGDGIEDLLIYSSAAPRTPVEVIFGRGVQACK